MHRGNAFEGSDNGNDAPVFCKQQIAAAQDGATLKDEANSSPLSSAVRTRLLLRSWNGRMSCTSADFPSPAQRWVMRNIIRY